MKADITTRTFCNEFQETTKKRIIENHENQTSDIEENKLWRIDEDSYDWSCLTGCPPGFDCSGYPGKPIKPCHHGASDFETKECSDCPTGHVCIPGRLPYPCPLGQYVSAKLVNGAEKITFAGEEFAIDNKYTCIDCPRESFLILFIGIYVFHIKPVTNVISRLLNRRLVRKINLILIRIKQLVKNVTLGLVKNAIKSRKKTDRIKLSLDKVKSAMF